MSAYIVSPSLINSILCHIDKGKDGQCSAKPFADIGHKLDTREGLQLLGEDLWALNHESIHQRYGDSPDPTEHFKFQPGKVLKSRPQIVKHARCLMYQSCEGDCDQKPLYEALAQFSYRVAFSFVQDMDEYDQAEW
jgi:hypothetical protein